MKKNVIATFMLASMLGMGTIGVNAATNTEENDNTIVLDDGTIIAYDNSVINGGVDLNKNMSTDSQKLSNDNFKINERAASSVILSIPFETQKYYNYCAPAAGKMLLATIGLNYTQDEVAAEIGTYEDGTDAGNQVANGLNKLADGSKYAFTWEWYTYSPSTVSNVQDHIVEALSYGNPVIVNTYETEGDCYLIGHDGWLPLYHYGLVGDYFNYGEEVTYTDPGAGFYSGFVVDQRVSIDTLCKAIGQRGYVW